MIREILGHGAQDLQRRALAIEAAHIADGIHLVRPKGIAVQAGRAQGEKQEDQPGHHANGKSIRRLAWLWHDCFLSWRSLAYSTVNRTTSWIVARLPLCLSTPAIFGPPPRG